MTELVELPGNRPIVLRNVNCAYCGRDFSPERPATKEHVIGRRFVPRGALNGQWNLILQACQPCNHVKSQLEDDISVITMLPDATGRYAIEDERLPAEALRRADKSGSRKTGRSVAKSQERSSVSPSGFSGVTMTFGFVAPPQVDRNRLYQLAGFHFRAFLFHCAYSKEQSRGPSVLGGYFPVCADRRSNWGAPLPRWFMDVTRDWALRAHGMAADGFFKIVIRKCPTRLLWSCAVEWNHSTRVLAFCGDTAAKDQLLAQYPLPAAPGSLSFVDSDGSTVRITEEVPLDEAHDTLFARDR
ncbi:HNH endonuclease [Phytopseudomonas dryadis]|uniref:HNH endonuclease n=1 Tax=Phytopseudomonas dryadis TaxID=2487520 RepID=A0A4Q9QUC6_9GAMM|nr:hypothetical protein [Pseudomonas dryadis]TBU86936.1 hypothetical protein DNK44_21710 [Pseudomonas dryadis]